VSDKGHVWGIEIACDPSLVQSCFASQSYAPAPKPPSENYWRVNRNDNLQSHNREDRRRGSDCGPRVGAGQRRTQHPVCLHPTD
jgi:hypothetical protein